jgi:hypothetical protein
MLVFAWWMGDVFGVKTECWGIDVLIFSILFFLLSYLHDDGDGLGW